MINPPIISPYSAGESLGISQTETSGAQFQYTWNSVAWPNANQGLAVPFEIQSPFRVIRMFTYNGAVVSGNWDLAVYSYGGGAGGARMISTGSTVQAGTNAPQIIDVTPTTLAPGRYFLVLVADNTTATFFRSALAGHGDGLIGQVTSTLPLPSTVAVTTITTSKNFTMCGIASIAML